MTPRQERFCREYIIDLNATQSAIRAGYSAQYANRFASNLMKKKEIKELIHQLQKNDLQELKITYTKVLQELASVAFSSNSSNVKTGDKIKALNILLKHLYNPYILDTLQERPTDITIDT